MAKDTRVTCITKLNADEAARFDAVAAAHNISRYELLRRAALGVVEEYETQNGPRRVEPAPSPAPSNGGMPAALVERKSLIMAVHELGMRRAAAIRQLEADASELEGTDPVTAGTLRAVAADLRRAVYTWDGATGRWSLAVGDARQSHPAPGFHPDALILTEANAH